MATYGAESPPDIIGYLIGPTPAPQVLPVQNGAIVVADPSAAKAAASLATMVGQLQATIAAQTEELILLRAQVFILGQMQNISYEVAYELGAEIDPSGEH